MNTGAHVLVVEDEKNVGETLAERLQAAGYRVTLAGTAARARLAWRAQAPQLALLDVGLPDGNGFELAAELRAQKSRMLRFVETFTTKVNYYMQLADFFIGKPGPGSVSEALAMHLPVIVECNAWTLPQERYNADWILENQVGEVLSSFKEIERAVARLIEPATLARYRANAAALEYRAVFEIPEFLEQILKRSRVAAAGDEKALLTGRLA